MKTQWRQMKIKQNKIKKHQIKNEKTIEWVQMNYIKWGKSMQHNENQWNTMKENDMKLRRTKSNEKQWGAVKNDSRQMLWSENKGTPHMSTTGIASSVSDNNS